MNSSDLATLFVLGSFVVGILLMVAGIEKFRDNK